MTKFCDYMSALMVILIAALVLLMLTPVYSDYVKLFPNKQNVASAKADSGFEEKAERHTQAF